MVFRITSSAATVLLFSGLLDEAAIEALSEHCCPGTVERLVLKRCTEIDPFCVTKLFELGVEIDAEAPHLARLLERLRRHSSPSPVLRPHGHGSGHRNPSEPAYPDDNEEV